MPEAVALVGTGDYHKIVNVIERAEAGERVKEVSPEPTYIADETTPRYRTTTEGVAYLRVAEGCDYRCAFCIIPHLRGNQRSRSIESIVTEAERLAAEGVQEIILISQITTNYGLDLYGEPKLAELLRAPGQSRCALDSDALRLPHWADSKGDRSHAGHSQCPALLGLASTALPS